MALSLFLRVGTGYPCGVAQVSRQGMDVRFNDIVQTVLAAPEGNGFGAVTQWRQCIDLLAQYDRADKPTLSEEDRRALVERLVALRSRVSETQRIASVVDMGARLQSPALVECFAQDRPAVCAAAMARARLPDAMWPALLSRLGPTARGVLRGRRDMGEQTVRALEAFGAHDLALGNAAGEAASDALELTAEMATSADAPSQIRELVDRIEKFTASGRLRAEPQRAPLPAEEEADAPAETRAIPARGFAFETDAVGTIIWVEGASRAAVIGLAIGETALPGETGPDGHIAGAFARRSSFQHGRFRISDGPYEGEWRLSAVPFFDPVSGRFQGYRGQARRPYLHEVPHAARTTQQGTVAERGDGFSFDAMRQLIHELRTPLNAILGFAEIIEQQLFGPADVHYREMAGNILSDARRLLTAFDDLDLAARSTAAGQGGSAAQTLRPCEMEPLVEQAAAPFLNGEAGGRTVIRITTAAGLPQVLVDPGQGQRMIQHLLRTLVSVLREGEALLGSVWYQPDGQGGQVLLAFDRPERLAGLEEAQMLDPGYGADGSWPDAPLLGLGFSLRLVRSLATAHKGALRIDGNRLILAFPVADARPDGEVGAP